MKKTRPEQLTLIGEPDRELTPGAIAREFDPARLTQARHLAAMTKKELADAIHVTPAAVGQYEAGMRPRPDLIPAISNALNVPAKSHAGRPHARLDASMAHFRSLRSTRAFQRAKAVAFTEQLWELTYALEKSVRLTTSQPPRLLRRGKPPPSPASPPARSRRPTPPRSMEPRRRPVRHLIRTMEAHGIITAIVPFDDPDIARVDAFSTSRLPRPAVILTPDRAQDVYRHRFTAAHELGHLILHGDTAPGDPSRRRRSRHFRSRIPHPTRKHQPPTASTHRLRRPHATPANLGRLRKIPPLPIRELGHISDSAASRAYQRLHTLETTGALHLEPTTSFPENYPTS